ncbi:divalent metal cation transporter [Acidithiobacillus ferrooxidans]|uniref:NRAMP family divalent metal transporter n=1 Tax=Acidithiobacillus ferrooxidans TaxID=920 RepID=UPI00214BADBD|nr:divalent metal cation transporter [Acidithiobacillus ferrooxidans]MCR2829012.1 divalent metal cation transporter [Acidithiobacillus ferrooxidans]
MTLLKDKTTTHKLADEFSSEDIDRSKDRSRVLAARRNGRRGMLLWLLLGPGVLTMLGENDGPSMLSYAASGATYGLGFFLPFIVVAFAAAYVVQEMSMRLGAVTHRGYGELIFQRFGPFWGWLAVSDLVVTNLVTLITEVIAIRVGMSFFGISAQIAVICAVALVVVNTLGSRYSRWERLTMGLALFNLLFLAVAFFARPSPGAVAEALLTWTPLPTGTPQEFLLLLTSNIGATVTPWMLFFQQSASADKGLTPKDIPQGRLDTGLGTVLAAITGCAALVAAVPLFAQHINVSNLQGGAGYAEALRPIIGAPGATMFALGLIEAGAVAMLTISASTAYAIGEAFGGVGHSFNQSISEAPFFHAANIAIAIAAGLIVLIPNSPLLAITLNANMLATILMPPALVFLLVLVNDREIMGPWVNSWRGNMFGILITALIILAGTAYAIMTTIGTFMSPRT